MKKFEKKSEKGVIIELRFNESEGLLSLRYLMN